MSSITPTTLPDASTFKDRAEAYQKEHNLPDPKGLWSRLRSIVTWLKYHIILTFTSFSVAKKADCVFKNAISEKASPTHLTHIGADTATEIQNYITTKTLTETEVVQLSVTLKHAYCIARSEVSKNRIATIGELALSTFRATLEVKRESSGGNGISTSQSAHDQLDQVLTGSSSADESSTTVEGGDAVSEPVPASKTVQTLIAQREAVEVEKTSIQQSIDEKASEVEQNQKLLQEKQATFESLKLQMTELEEKKEEYRILVSASKSDKTSTTAVENKKRQGDNLTEIAKLKKELEAAEKAETTAAKKLSTATKGKTELEKKLVAKEKNVANLDRQIGAGKKDSVFAPTRRSIGEAAKAVSGAVGNVVGKAKNLRSPKATDTTPTEPAGDFDANIEFGAATPPSQTTEQ